MKLIQLMGKEIDSKKLEAYMSKPVHQNLAMRLAVGSITSVGVDCLSNK